jgi:hypothetical protein
MDLHQLLERIKPGPIKRTLLNLGLTGDDVQSIGQVGALRYLGTLCQLAAIASHDGLSLLSDFAAVRERWDKDARLNPMVPLFALIGIRNLRGHVQGQASSARFADALSAFGISEAQAKRGWGLVLDRVYDALIESLSEVTKLIDAATSLDKGADSRAYGPKDMKDAAQAERYIGAIRDLGPVFDRLSESFRSDATLESEFDRFSSDDWRRNTYGNALIRLRILTENNFRFIETLGLLAATRYIFELSVWLRLFRSDNRYCLVYYKELLETQLRYSRDTLAQLHREVDLLEKFEAIENGLTIDITRAASTSSAQDLGQMTRQAMGRVDAEAGKHFSLYLDDAKNKWIRISGTSSSNKGNSPGGNQRPRDREGVAGVRAKCSRGGTRSGQGALAMAIHVREGWNSGRARLYLLACEQASARNARIDNHGSEERRNG